MIRRLTLLPFFLVLLAALVRFWLAPRASWLPADYSNETHYAAQVRFRETPEGEWDEFPLQARRVDQVLVVNGDVAVIQGESHWTMEDGTPTYEPINLYGVNRQNRLNVPGYGDVERFGQYLFPSHLDKKTYQFWDPYYVGPRTATFDRVEWIEGLPVYVFAYTAVDLDDTAGYTILPDVPERYRTLSNGEGSLWIEPVSGIVVNFEDRGRTDFVDPETGEHVADFYHWTARYTDETRVEQLKQALTARLRIHSLEVGLPLALLLLAAILFGLSVHPPDRKTD